MANTETPVVQETAGAAANILALFNENPVIGYGGVIVVILLILMAIRRLSQGDDAKGDADGDG